MRRTITPKAANAGSGPSGETLVGFVSYFTTRAELAKGGIKYGIKTMSLWNIARDMLSSDLRLYDVARKVRKNCFDRVATIHKVRI
jgi:hypothetical protein